MTACDPFRIALEQRAHGALGDPEALALDAHLSTCSACQAYAAEARALEAVMGAAAAESMQQMDWTVVERAISGWRRRSRLVIGVAVGFALYTLAPLVLSLARVPGRPERNLPALGVIASLSLGFLALAVASASRLRREARLTAQGDQAALLAVLREDLARRIRALRLARWLLLARLREILALAPHSR